MKITYIYHSCFVLEFDTLVCIFDYYKGKLPVFEKDKPIIFFASHKHQDHFVLEVFEYAKQYNNVTYVLSNDIKLSPNYLLKHGINPEVKEKIISIGKNKETTIEIDGERLTVETLRSTDAGVAFILSYKEKVVYHAGDLNWWSWAGETEEEYTQMTQGYVSEINKLEGRNIDLAFVVLDPRQEDRFWWGFDYFMRTTNTKVVFPMHCWGDYSIIDQLLQKEVAKPYKNKIERINSENQSFEV